MSLGTTRFLVGKFARAGVAASALVAGLAACGSSEREQGSIAYEDFPKALANAVCDNIGPCCTAEGFGHDAATCHTKTESGIAESMKELSAQGVMYDAAAARDCVDTYASVARSCGAARSIEEPCDRVFRGTLQNGEPCRGNEQCASRSCRVLQGMDGSRCAPERIDPVHAKLGDPCTFTCTVTASGDGCTANGTSSPDIGRCYTDDGLLCSSTRVCESAPAVGEACTTACAGDAFCDRGACVPKRSTGPCTTYDACSATSFCDEIARECKPKKALGEPCSALVDCKEGRCIASPRGSTNLICKHPSIAEERRICAEPS